MIHGVRLAITATARSDQPCTGDVGGEIPAALHRNRLVLAGMSYQGVVPKAQVSSVKKSAWLHLIPLI
jgi:hypothetical protein